ncbi:MAG: RecX family transcriptional regulator [Dehalococcoidia bacterium]
MIVTAIKPQKKGRKRLNLYLDGEFAFGLSPAVLDEAGISSGQELSDSDLKRIKRAEHGQQALERAHRFLAHRPRSEFEVRRRLERYGYDPDIIESTLIKLRADGLVDDESFAAFWKRNRQEFNSRSARMLALELRSKGVDRDIIAATVEGVDDQAEAERAGRRKARSLPAGDYYQFRKKLAGFLSRRGFNYEVIGNTVDRLWQERFREDQNG